MRAFAYIRVSKERDDMISPEIQRDEISRYCERKGWEVSEWFQDLDLSGRAWDRKKRTGLDDLMGRALAGECDAVVFYRIDRLSREEADLHAMLAALQRAGVVCDSPGNPNDGSPEAALLWSISAALAKYESVRLGARLKDAHKKLARMGRWSGGPVPWGWRRVRDDAGVRLAVDEELQEVRLWMHSVYQQGWAFRRIAKSLNQRGIFTRRGRLWYDITVKHCLATPWQVGARIADGELVFGGNIQAIVPLEVYQMTMAAMEARKNAPKEGRLPRVPLTGRHVRCGTCGGRMYCAEQHKGVRYFGCMNQRLGGCERGVSVRADWLVAEVERRLFERVGDAHARRREIRALDPIEPLAAEVRRVEETMGQLTSLYAAGEILEGEYREARKLQLRRLQEAERRREAAVRRSEAAVRSSHVEDMLSSLTAVGPDGWAALSLEAKRDIFDIVLDRVIVYPKENPRGRGQGPHKIKVLWR